MGIILSILATIIQTVAVLIAKVSTVASMFSYMEEPKLPNHLIKRD